MYKNIDMSIYVYIYIHFGAPMGPMGARGAGVRGQKDQVFLFSFYFLFYFWVSNLLFHGFSNLMPQDDPN